MTTKNEELIAKIIDGAEDVCERATSEEQGEKPRLLVESCNPDQTVAALRDILAGCQSASKIDPLTACNFDPPGGASRERARPIAP